MLHQNAGEWEGNHQEKGNRDTLGPPPHPASQCMAARKLLTGHSRTKDGTGASQTRSFEVKNPCIFL